MNLRMTTTPFGHALKDARVRRGLSQYELAHRARSTARHLSFLETGRSRPSEEMVLRLSRCLDLPLRQRNALLRAAGHPPAFGEGPIDDVALRPVNAVIERLLAAHEPFPAYVVDARWRFVRGNRGGAWMWDAIGAGSGQNVLLALFDGPMAGAIENADALAWQAWETLQRDALATRDPLLLAELDVLSTRLRGKGPPPKPSGPVLAAHVRFGPHTLRLVTTVCRIGNATDVAIDELRVELVFPEDPDTEAVLRALATGDPTAALGGGPPGAPGPPPG
jgi:transcriptional regulator with XRE-family HTH domain